MESHHVCWFRIAREKTNAPYNLFGIHDDQLRSIAAGTLSAAGKSQVGVLLVVIIMACRVKHFT
jgi:hypothetical protein